MHEQLTAYLAANPLPAAVTTVVLCGHSLGGALATICAATFLLTSAARSHFPWQHIHLVTFGAPRVGCARFATAVASPSGHGGHWLQLRRYVTVALDGTPDLVTDVLDKMHHAGAATLLGTAYLPGARTVLDRHGIEEYITRVAVHHGRCRPVVLRRHAAAPVVRSSEAERASEDMTAEPPPTPSSSASMVSPQSPLPLPASLYTDLLLELESTALPS
jgi:pimeloyl-ACP methyl ester carboxylesterase